jgi:Poly(3-hydroxyalkanoate) synthetase
MNHEPKVPVIFAKTTDGWEIALHHHAAKSKRHPVLLVHGLASNYRNMDFPLKDYSLARFLCKHGFDTWVVDLRGSGLSRKGRFRRYRWFFDDFVFKDLPAAVDLLLKKTGAKQFHWIGHSLGGLLAFPFHQTYEKKNILKSLVTVASPITTASRPGYFKITYRLDKFLKFFSRIPYKFLSKLGTRFVDNLLGYRDHVLFAKDNMTREILLTIMHHAVESVPTSLVLQIHDWLRHNYFASRDRKVDFQSHLYLMTAPMLMITGSVDTFTPMADIRLAFRKFPKTKKKLMVFGKAKGHQSDYGHIDLLLGKNAPKEVFPHILSWLEEHD